MAKVIAKNKRAFFDYEILDRYEAGIVLLGWEIKSIRAGKVSLNGAFTAFKGDELLASNINISQYMNVSGDETRPRKLLLHKAQLKKIKNARQAKGLTVVPLTLKWNNKGLVKLDIALARGRKQTDKRELIKTRDNERNKKARH